MIMVYVIMETGQASPKSIGQVGRMEELWQEMSHSLQAEFLLPQGNQCSVLSTDWVRLTQIIEDHLPYLNQLIRDVNHVCNFFYNASRLVFD